MWGEKYYGAQSQLVYRDQQRPRRLLSFPASREVGLVRAESYLFKDHFGTKKIYREFRGYAEYVHTRPYYYSIKVRIGLERGCANT